MGHGSPEITDLQVEVITACKRIAELERELDLARRSIQGMGDPFERGFDRGVESAHHDYPLIKAENKRYRDALEWYAEEEDGGGRATQALAAKEANDDQSD